MEIIAYTILLFTAQVLWSFIGLTALLEGRTWHSTTLGITATALIAFASFLRPVDFVATAFIAANPVLVVGAIITVSFLVLGMLRMWIDSRRMWREAL